MTKKSFSKRLLSLLLALILIVPANVYAAPTEAETGESPGVTWEKVDDKTIEGRKKAHEAKQSEISSEAIQAGDVRVSIIVDGESAMEAGYSTQNMGTNSDTKRYRGEILARQNALADKISKEALGGKKLDVVWNLTLVTNIISANVPAIKIEEIKKVDGVLDVIVENQYRPDATVETNDPNMSNASGMTGVQPMWSGGYTGAGSTVAIIDTGLDTDHQSFDAEAFEYAIEQTGKEVDLLEESEVAAVWDQLNISRHVDAGAADAYLTSKVPFAVNYVDSDLDVTHDNDKQGEHGSHVAGIAAANRYVKINGEYTNALESVYTQGNAPDAQILVMKVFGKGGGAYDSDYMAAIEDSIVLGADSANLSLGSSVAGYPVDDLYKGILDSLTESSTVVVMSQGNSGSWADNTQMGYLYSDGANLHTGGSPGSYKNSLAVASVDNDGFTGAYLKQGDNMIFYTENTDKGNAPMASITGDYEYVYLDGVGTEEQFAALADTLEGKIAICNRGETNFSSKANAAISNSAKALLIANNQPGTISMDLTGYEHTAPVVSITQADGALLKENAASSSTITVGDAEYTVYSGEISVAEDITVVEYDADYYTMSDFSSWGVPSDLSLKPEITAPGGNIYSVNGLPAGGTAYENMSGTSMAAPQIAGLVAVLNQYIRENDMVAKTGLTERQLNNSLLMSTAQPLIEADSGSYYSVLKQGAGLADIDAAANAKSYIWMDSSATDSAADGKVKVELGDDPERTGAYSATFTVNNMSDKDVKIGLRADFFTQDVFEYGATYLDTWTVPLSSSVTWYVDGVDIAARFNDKYDFNGDGNINELDVQALLDYVVGNLAEISCKEHADIDEDGDIDTYDAYLAELAYRDLETVSIPAGGKITVTANIAIPGLADYDDKGCYVEGYLFAEELAEEDGAQGVTHSIPVLGYYGSWSEPEMTDLGSAIEYAYEMESRAPYMYAAIGDAATMMDVYLIKSAGEKKAYYFIGNPYGLDEKYMPERNAINSKTTITEFDYSLVRNALASRFTVKDAEDKVIYETAGGSEYAAYYDDHDGKWYNTNSRLKTNFTPTDLAEGTQLTLNITMAPFYYRNDDGSINWDALSENAIQTMPVVIDNTAPVIKNVELVKDEETGALTAIKVTASDNEYIAAASLNTEENEELSYFGSDVNDQKGQEKEYLFELTEEPPAHLYVFLGDYAANKSVYKINLNTEELSDEISVAIEPAQATVIKGNQVKLTAKVSPWAIDDESVTWTSADESIATVDEEGIVTGVEAGTVIITATSVKDPTKSADALVEVVVIDKDLNGVIWDENGERFISTFNLSTLPEYTKLSDHLSAGPITSIAVDEYTETMYGASFDENELLSTLYTIDPANGYELTEIGGPEDIAYTDIAAAPGLTEDYGSDVLVGTYGPYLAFIDAKTGDYISAYLFSGNLVGVAYEASGEYSEGVYYDWYYFIDTEGNVHETGFLYMDETWYWFGDNEDGNLGYTTSIDYYNSVYISYEEDGTENLYWSRFEPSENYVEILQTELIYDEEGNVSLGETLSVGQFADNVWPVGGLYEEAAEESGDTGNRHNISRYSLESAALAPDEIDKDQLKGGPVKGRTNGLKETEPSAEETGKKIGKGETAKTQATGIAAVGLEITADATESEDEIHNGLYKVEWDSKLLELVSYDGDAQFKSALTGDGSLTYGFVDEEGFAADETVLGLSFKRLDKTAEAKVKITTLDNGSENPGTTQEYKFGENGGVNPHVSVTGIEIEPAEASIVVAEELPLTVTVTPADASEAALTFTSSDETIAAVDEKGVVTGTGIGTATITATAKDGGITAETAVTVLFKDVADSAKYYFTPVYWAAEQGITNGYMSPSSAKYGTFGVGEDCTREQMVTFLWRQEGKPEPTTSSMPFSDVKAGSYYYNAVLWAYEQGITKGYSSGPNKGKFGVGLTVTREDSVTFLYRAAGKPEVIVSGNPFPDVPTSAYYCKPIVWAVDKGITKGYSSGQYKGKFGVGVNVLREQVVTFQYRYDQSK